MPKYTKTTITQLSANEQAALDQINKNFDDIQTAIADTVSRSGTIPSHMTNDLDMNGKRIINVPAPKIGTDLVRQQDVVGDIETVQQLVNATTNAAAQTLKAAQDVQEILEDAHVGLVADDLALGDNSTIHITANNMSSVSTVALNINAINTANSNITNIDTVATNISNVNSVGSNISNINTCVANMSAITSAPTYASNASGSADAAAASAASAAISAATMRLSLFDYKWTDYEIADQCWLKANTFSWQDGTVYTNAYNHLVDDIDGKTATSETIGSYTISYYLADDGHKITTDETTVANIYAESGVAWYYVLDTANTRFKLPRENPAREELIQVIRAKGDGNTIGYQITADGETRGVAEFSSYRMATTTTIGAVGDSATVVTMNQGKFIGLTKDSAKSGIVASMTDSTSVYKGKKYLYFYVGQYTQTATEQTAGLNAELFNGKMDLDMSNMNPSQTAKQTIIRLSEPDWSAGVDIVVPVQATPYICPSDGVYVACFIPTQQPTYLYINGVKTANCFSNSSSNNANKSSISVRLEKDDSIYFTSSYSGSNLYSSAFYPLKGVTNA